MRAGPRSPLYSSTAGGTAAVVTDGMEFGIRLITLGSAGHFQPGAVAFPLNTLRLNRLPSGRAIAPAT
jgi:hypothetical protein